MENTKPGISLISLKDIIASKSHLLPMVIYDVDIIKNQIQELKYFLKNKAHKLTIAYSYKSNPSLGQIMRGLGSSFQVTSINHLKDVKRLFGKPKSVRVIFNSRSLEKDELQFVLRNNAHLVINSLYQYYLVEEYAKKFRKKIEIGVRIDTQINPKDTFFKTINAGLGLTQKQVDQIPNKSKYILVIGLHTHIASQNVDPLSLKQGLGVIYEIIEKRSFEFKYLNIGGGFPIQYDKQVPAVNQFIKPITPILKKLNDEIKNFELIIEPGRYIVGPSGILATKITDITNTKDYEVITVNSSIFSSVRDRILSKYDIQLPCVVANKSGMETNKKNYLIVGSSPSSCDVFGEYRLPKVEIGDILVFLQAGAYCLSNDDFTGVEKPKEFIFYNKRLTKV